MRNAILTLMLLLFGLLSASANPAGFYEGLTAARLRGNAVGPTVDPVWDGLDAYWPLDGDGAELIGGFNGTVGNLVTFTNDAIGGMAGKFRKGVNPETPANLSIQTPFRFVGSTNAGAETAYSTDVTVSAWVKYFPGSAGSVDSIFEGAVAAFLGYNFGTPTLQHNHQTYFIPTPSGGTAIGGSYTAASYRAWTNWTHVAFVTTRNPTSFISTFYVNGAASMTTTNAHSGRQIYQNAAMVIGQRGALSNRADTWPGLIDEFAIFKRALTSNEISRISNEQLIYRAP